MAATNFVDGSHLTPAIANTWYQSTIGTGQGHAHDGVDADGHAQKIDLTTMVAGVLPAANTPQINLAPGVTGPGMTTGYLTMGQITGMSGYVDVSTNQTVTGIKTFGSGIVARDIGVMGPSTDYYYGWAPRSINSGILPVNSLARCYTQDNGSDGTGYRLGFIAGQIVSTTSITGGIPITAFGLPLDNMCDFNFVFYVSWTDYGHLRVSRMLDYNLWTDGEIYRGTAGNGNYSTTAGVPYFAFGRSGTNLYIACITAVAGTEALKFSARLTMVGTTF